MANTTILPYLDNYKQYPLFEEINSEVSKLFINLADYLCSKYFGKEIHLWGTGTSGLTICVLTAQHLPLHVVKYVEKANVKSHKGHYPYFDPDAVNILLDDCISTGKTIHYILDNYNNKVWDELIILHRLEHRWIETFKFNFKWFTSAKIG